MNPVPRIPITETAGDGSSSPPSWAFLTNHAHVLVCVTHDPGMRLRDIAGAVGITERAAHKIVSELVEEGYLLRERVGRRNRYQVVEERPLRHPLIAERQVGELLEALVGPRAKRKEEPISKR